MNSKIVNKVIKLINTSKVKEYETFTKGVKEYEFKKVRVELVQNKKNKETTGRIIFQGTPITTISGSEINAILRAITAKRHRELLELE